MKTDIFEKQKFSYEEISAAVDYGFKYGLESQHYGKVPDGNIQQWLMSTVERTAEEWFKLDPSVVVIEHTAAWKSKVAWYEEKITFQEYQFRRQQCVCMDNKTEENEL